MTRVRTVVVGAGQRFAEILPAVNPAMDAEDLSLANLVCSSGVLGAYQQCCLTPDYWCS